ncbi:unnamed protein product [Lactuca virosa]|uniref:F-box domain-containing protein n=1 Tax=Lactuca virosa TaxID=75947 RepID=A0AAU9MXY6_9ASTR|nr:unnamed protein product [Lactuca virosa]
MTLTAITDPPPLCSPAYLVPSLKVEVVRLICKQLTELSNQQKTWRNLAICAEYKSPSVQIFPHTWSSEYL